MSLATKRGKPFVATKRGVPIKFVWMETILKGTIYTIMGV
jgi:hypothetical protein